MDYYNWDKKEIQDLLIALLVVTGGGCRAHVPCRMTIKEFLEAKANEDGDKEVSVKNHKTKAQGPAPLPFILNGLYEACNKFLTQF